MERAEGCRWCSGGRRDRPRDRGRAGTPGRHVRAVARREIVGLRQAWSKSGRTCVRRGGIPGHRRGNGRLSRRPAGLRQVARQLRAAQRVRRRCRGGRGARLVFADNLYMYGPGSSPMLETTPQRAADRKGRSGSASLPTCWPATDGASSRWRSAGHPTTSAPTGRTSGAGSAPSGRWSPASRRPPPDGSTWSTRSATCRTSPGGWSCWATATRRPDAPGTCRSMDPSQSGRFWSARLRSQGCR